MNAEVDKCTIANNHTEIVGIGSGINAIGNDVNVNVTNSIIWNNTFGNSYSNSEPVKGYDFATINLNNCIIEGGYEGVGNIDVDPFFCDSENNNFGIAANSPALSSATSGGNIGSFPSTCDAVYQGPIWYVSTSGSNLNDGSEASPFSTLQSAIDAASDGHTIYIASGTYTPQDLYNNNTNLTGGPTFYSKSGITIIGEDPANTIFNSFNNNGMIFSGSSNISLSNLTIRNAGSNLILAQNSESIQFSNCVLDFISVWEVMLSAYDGSYSFNKCTIISNKNGAYAFFDYYDLDVSNSIFYGADGLVNGAFTNQNFDTNIFFDVPNQGVVPDGNNLIEVDPFFCDADNGDYSLAANSPAVGASTDGGTIGALPATCEALYLGPDWYVSTSGSNSNNGSSSSPFSGIQSAIDAASDGHTIHIASGTYTQESSYISGYYGGPNFNGKSGITVIGEDLASTIVDGFTEDGMAFSFSSDISISNLTIKNTGRFLLIGTNSNNNIQFSNCVFDGSEIQNDYQSRLFESYEGSYSFNKCTFIGNPENPDYYVFNSGFTLNVSNSIFYGFYSLVYQNFANQNFDTNILYDVIESQDSGNNFISVDPFFCDADNGNYSLAANSPALNASTDGGTIGALPATCEAVYAGPYWYTDISSGSNSNEGSISSPFSSIQSAIDVASDGHTIIVNPGTYNENIEIGNLSVTLGSLFLTTGDVSYVSSTILDGQSNGSVIKISGQSEDGGFNGSNGYIDKDVIISGLTIQNGAENFNVGNSYGSGVCVESFHSVTIDQCIIQDNEGGQGGGISTGYGVGLLKVKNSVVRLNDGNSNIGAGISAGNHNNSIGEFELQNSIIHNNSNVNEGGGLFINSDVAIILNSTIANNESFAVGSAIFFNSGSSDSTLITEYCYFRQCFKWFRSRWIRFKSILYLSIFR